MEYIIFAILVASFYVHSGLNRIKNEVRVTKREQLIINLKQEVQLALLVSAFVAIFLLVQKVIFA